MSLGRKKFPFILILAASAGGIFWRHFQHKPIPFWPSASTSRGEVYLVRASSGVFASDLAALPSAAVTGVVDGDTLHVLYEGRGRKLRYYGANTPEKDQACYEEATARNRALAGERVWLLFDERPEDKYGRMLAYVFNAEGRSIEAQLVAEGLAPAWKRDGRFKELIAGVEEEARRKKIGCLWSGEAKRDPAGKSAAEAGRRKKAARSAVRAPRRPPMPKIKVRF